MRVAIIGASGNIGSYIRDEALARGHQVTAIVRHPEKITVRDPLLTTVKADILIDKVDELVKGHDAVISATMQAGAIQMSTMRQSRAPRRLLPGSRSPALRGY